VGKIISAARLVFILTISSQFIGCSTLSYYGHLVSGQVSLLWQGESIESLVENEKTEQKLKDRLILSQQVIQFAAAELMLPVDDAYTSYSDLERPYAVWNVYAAPELSMDAHKWCYPLAGCFAYRGYFNQAMAEREAQELVEQGLDIKVGGVLAYSTLGFFDDPILNTFLFKSEAYLVELLIHEISHRKLYIKNDTMFNENFATAVALIGAEQWYAQRGGSEVFAVYQAHKQRQSALTALLLRYKNKLEVLYQNVALSDEEKRAGKKETLLELHQAYQVLKHENAWDKRFDQWVLSMNNAAFSTLSNYQALVPYFLEMYQQKGEDWSAFFTEVERISLLEKEPRHAALREYMPSK
jgi:predicted aminopeptidase